MRYETFKENGFYLVSNQGVSSSKIFFDDADYVRFIFLITHFQSPIQIYNLNWSVKAFIKKNSLRTRPERISAIVKNRSIELLAFSLKDNEFNFLVRNIDEAILSVYMHRISTAYSKYFNSKYSKRGHVFAGPFRAMHIKNKDDLVEVSAYLHKGCVDLEEKSKSKSKYEDYKWSSYSDYVSMDRWSGLLHKETIMGQFKNTDSYKKFVAMSDTKEPLF